MAEPLTTRWRLDPGPLDDRLRGRPRVEPREGPRPLQGAGKTTPIEFEAAVQQLDDELEVDGTAHADQRALGMPSPLGMIRSPVRLTLHGRLVTDGD